MASGVLPGKTIYVVAPKLKEATGFVWIFAAINALLVFLTGIIPPEAYLAFYLVAVPFLLAYRNRFRMMLPFFAVILVHTLVAIVLQNTTILGAAKQLIGIFLGVTYYSVLFDFLGSEWKSLIKCYFVLAAITSGFCLVQHLAFRLGIKPIYDTSWIVIDCLPVDHVTYRANAFFGEPSFCAFILLPAAFLGAYSLFGKKKGDLRRELKFPWWVCALPILGVLSTVSSSGFIAIGFVVVLILCQYRFKFRTILFFLVVFSFGIIAAMATASIRMRIEDTIRLFASPTLQGGNISSQTFFINFRVALLNLKGSFGLGTGLGSHPIAYDRYIDIIDPKGIAILNLNQEDANSLLFRLVSELGIFGIGGLIYVLVRFWPTKSYGVFRVLSLMCLGCSVMAITSTTAGCFGRCYL